MVWLASHLAALSAYSGARHADVLADSMMRGVTRAIEQLEEQLQQRVEVRSLFTVEWALV